jgi:hypothetical protein
MRGGASRGLRRGGTAGGGRDGQETEGDDGQAFSPIEISPERDAKGDCDAVRVLSRRTSILLFRQLSVSRIAARHTFPLEAR